MTDSQGIDLVRRALDEARATARASGRAVRSSLPVGRGNKAGNSRRFGGARRRGWSGARPDDRDPQPLSELTTVVARARGWSPAVAQAAIFGQWSEVVGRDVAQHANPTTLTDGVLGIVAESTAWATQLRLLQNQLLARISKTLGPDVVRSLRITGPTAPSWDRGPRRIRGRGPRDTYG